MRCFIYKSSRKDGLYLYLAQKDDFSGVPQALLDGMGEPAFVMELELTPDRKLAREDAAQVLLQLRNRGFFVQMPPPQAAEWTTLQ
ncbi:MAG: YcgL domain-containing protein [Gammaproteobacteria bacterium]